MEVIPKGDGMPKIIRINTSDTTAQFEDFPEKYTWFGGRELTSTIVHDEVDAECDPLGTGNKVIIAVGLLAGTLAPNLSRTSVGCKSPLTGGIKEANVGGKSGFILGQNDIRAIVIENQPPKDEFFHVVIQDNQITFEDASNDKYLGNYELMANLISKHGTNVAIISIGPAGARRFPMASVAINDLQNYTTRHAARGGTGAVMGSKGIKSIIIYSKPGGKMQYSDENAFKDLAKTWSKQLKVANAQGFGHFGTALMLAVTQSAKCLPTRNYSSGVFEDVNTKFNGETMHDLILSRGGKVGIPCLPGCAVQCSNIFLDDHGNHVTSSLEYETLALDGSNLMIGDLD